MKKTLFLLRLIPVFLFVAILSLSLRIGDAWYHFKEGEKMIGTLDALAQNAISMAPEATTPQTLTESEILVLQQLAKRRAALDEREHILTVKQKELEQLEQQITTQKKELQSLQKKLEEQNLHLLDDDMTYLIKIYANMRPQEAARLLQTQDAELRKKIIRRLPAPKSAAILEKMDTETALSLTRELNTPMQP